MWDAVRNNLLMLMLGILALIIYVIVMAASGEASPEQVLNFMMAMSYT